MAGPNRKIENHHRNDRDSMYLDHQTWGTPRQRRIARKQEIHRGAPVRDNKSLGAADRCGRFKPSYRRFRPVKAEPMARPPSLHRPLRFLFSRGPMPLRIVREMRVLKSMRNSCPIPRSKQHLIAFRFPPRRRKSKAIVSTLTD